MTTSTTPYIDTSAVRARFNRVASCYESASFIEERLAADLLNRLNFMSLAPKTILDLGTGTGRCARAMAQRYPEANIVGVDFASAMIEQAQHEHNSGNIIYSLADAHVLPFAPDSFDLVISNALFPFIADIDTVFQQVQKILTKRGCFIFTTFGPDTLYELRHTWSMISDAPHVLPFMDMHDVGDALIASGLVEPLLDRDTLTVTYQDVSKMFLELKNAGLTNCLTDREKGLLGKNTYKKLLTTYPFDTSKNCYPVTLEVIYGLAWQSEQLIQQTVHGNEIHIPVSSLRK